MTNQKEIKSYQSPFKNTIFFVAMFFFSIIYAQNEISVPFTVGFIGTVGSNSQTANNIKTFNTLGVNRAFFVQNSNSNIFQVQGNDITGSVRLQLNNGQVINIPGAIVWRLTSGSTLHAFGFIPSTTIQPVSFTYGSSLTYTINSTSNFGLRLIASTYAFTDNTSESGNAATTGLLTALNDYLATTQSLRPAGPVTVNTLTTSNKTPTLTGTATLAAGQTLTVSVNNVLYSTSNGLTVSNGTWSLPIPNGNALSVTTYSVTATITNSSGYTLSDVTLNELTITLASSTIVATGSQVFTFTNSPQGPNTSTVTGSTGAVSYSYQGTGSTTYAASATRPTSAGT
jgi:hypothetical protein